MRQAIQTRYRGPTDYTGSRVIATCAAKRITVPWNHAHNPAENHRSAALALAARLEWAGPWVGGQLADGSYVFVTPETETTEAERMVGTVRALLAEIMDEDCEHDAETVATFVEALQLAVGAQ